MDKKVNIDYLQDEDEQSDDVREGFTTRRAALKPGTKGFLLFLLVILILMIGWAIKGFLPEYSRKEEGKVADAILDNGLPKHNFVVKKEKAKPLSLIPSMTLPVPPPLPSPSRGPSFDTAPQGEHIKSPEEIAMERRLGHDFGMIDGVTDTPQIGEGAQPAMVRQTYDGSAHLSNRLNGAMTLPAHAKIMAHQNLSIARGTVIPCGTLEEIDTTQPGFIECQVSENIWSMNGKVRLIDKGSRVDGEIASGLSDGQKRVFVTWTRLRTPEGVVVELDSPGVGSLGAPGLSGSVDTHFWDRFGNALLVSVLSDVGQAMIQSASNLAARKGSTNLNLGNTNSSSTQLANQVLQQTMNISPTLYKEQGADIMIFVARDLDFSDVYALQNRD